MTCGEPAWRTDDICTYRNSRARDSVWDQNVVVNSGIVVRFDLRDSFDARDSGSRESRVKESGSGESRVKESRVESRVEESGVVRRIVPGFDLRSIQFMSFQDCRAI